MILGHKNFIPEPKMMREHRLNELDSLVWVTLWGNERVADCDIVAKFGINQQLFSQSHDTRTTIDFRFNKCDT